MLAGTISGSGGQVTLVGVSDIWDSIKNSADKVLDTAKSALQKGCGYAAAIPPAHPYLMAAQGACLVSGMMPTVTGGSPGATATMPGAGGLLSNLQQQMTAAQQQAALMALSADKPWYKKPLPWVGIGAGVVVLGTGAFLLTRRGGKRRR